MSRIAFFSYGNMLEEEGHPQVQGFWDRVDSVFSTLDMIPGFIKLVDARAGKEPPYSYFFDPSKHKAYACNLSLWSSLEPVFAFAYKGRHGEAFRNREGWVGKPNFPNYVAWWVTEDHTPTMEEAYEQQRYLHELGPSSHAFSFKNAFDAFDRPYKIDKKVVGQLCKETPDLAPYRFQINESRDAG